MELEKFNKTCVRFILIKVSYLTPYGSYIYGFQYDIHIHVPICKCDMLPLEKVFFDTRFKLLIFDCLKYMKYFD